MADDVQTIGGIYLSVIWNRKSVIKGVTIPCGATSQVHAKGARKELHRGAVTEPFVGSVAQVLQGNSPQGLHCKKQTIDM
jgi:hypothetical protein